jgi:ADP-ribose pyrophosphatase YjhB (NUDIX family)
MKYCSECGAEVVFRIPPGDDRPRYICERCNTIHYENPKLVVGAIPEWEGRILLCLRSIEPRRGTWTLPAGFLENGETVIQGAQRETFEEARARVKKLTPYALFDLTFINQIYLLFRCQMCDPHIQPGQESFQVRLFSEEEIPWNRLAFPVIRETLKLYLSDRKTEKYPFRMGDIHPR